MTADLQRQNGKASTPLLTIGDVSDLLQVSRKTVRRWIVAGDLVAHRFGRQLRISEADLQTFIRSRREG
jgi:excisionase family DNA binding protein